jgi:predicted GIY-YIG superfamily endonuclease
MEHFMSQSLVRWNYYDNRHPRQVLPQVKAHLARQINRPACRFFYYGQTDDPEARFDRHQREMDDLGVARWDSMEVVYGHRSLGFVTDVENALIEHFARHPKYEAHGLNTAGTRYAGTRSFSVYVLCDDHPAGGAKTVETQPREDFITTGRGDAAARDAAVLAAFEQAILTSGPGAARPAALFYVGITNQPQRRLCEHQRIMGGVEQGNPWERMQVIFTTSSLDYALRAETLLIRHARMTYPQNLHNIASGRFHKLIEPDGSEWQPYFYVYYLEDRKP